MMTKLERQLAKISSKLEKSEAKVESAKIAMAHVKDQWRAIKGQLAEARRIVRLPASQRTRPDI